MSDFFYCRVSSNQQNLDRQIAAAKQIISDTRYIFTEKASGKDFTNRKVWNTLVGTENTIGLLQPKDTLYCVSLDRISRRYSDLKYAIQKLSDMGVTLRVLDMPILNQQIEGLSQRFLADLVISIMGFCAENERRHIRERQAAGIKIYKEKGGKFGPPPLTRPTEWDSVIAKVNAGEITKVQAMQTLGLHKTTFYRLLREQ